MWNFHMTIPSYNCRNSLNIYLQFFRYVQRKPRYIPKSPSKIFYVRTPTPRDPEETAELLTRYRHYRTALKSIHAFLKTWQKTIDRKVDDVEHNPELEAAEHSRLMAINDEWNKQVAVIREARIASEEQAEFNKISEAASSAQTQKSVMEEESRKRIIEESSLPFIREDELDDEIEKVMATCSDYNFSIDTDGNIYPQKNKI